MLIFICKHKTINYKKIFHDKYLNFTLKQMFIYLKHNLRYNGAYKLFY